MISIFEAKQIIRAAFTAVHTNLIAEQFGIKADTFKNLSPVALILRFIGVGLRVFPSKILPCLLESVERQALSRLILQRDAFERDIRLMHKGRKKQPL